MKTRPTARSTAATIALTVIVAAGLALGGRTARADALTLDAIIDKHIEATGGLANLRALKSVRMIGKQRFGSGNYAIEADFAQLRGRPGLYRDELTLQGMTAVNAWDGHEGWTMSPFGGRRDPERASADDTKTMAQDADLDGPLVDWKQKGHKVEYLGTEDIDGTEAHKLRVNLKDGDVQTIYLDPDAFLTIRIDQQTYVRGTESVTETDYGSYAQVAGVWFAFAVDAGAKGAPKTTHLTVERIETNVAADEALFRFPAKGQAVVRTIQAGAGGSAPVATAPRKAEPPAAPTLDAGVLSGLRARNIGSAQMSGRIAAVAATVVRGRTLLFVGAASGGVWKSQDGGTTFKPVFDRQSVQSIGAIAIDPSNPRTIWVGTGESWTRNSVSIGDGIYKSTDGGETWTNMGLADSERITRIVVSPKSPDVVYACAPGKLWSDSTDRGLYKTTDGGKTWSLILKGPNASTGCSGLALDPRNPEHLFAGMWDFRRKGWTFRSGGDSPEATSGSGLFVSTDAGAHWKPLSDGTAKGLPAAPWGRVEVVTAPSDAKIVYAFIESKESGLYRSSDGGATWEARDKSQSMVWRPFYFGRLVVDPTNPEKIFKPDGSLVVSLDGGKSFSGATGGSHGDWHDLWIDPTNNQHVIGGDDGGLWLSYDGGNRWWKGENLPISQFYHVSVDDKDPYKVYGGLQDNSAWVGDSAYPGGVSNNRWENLYGGDGFCVLVDPSDPNYVYAESQGGEIGRVDRRTLVSRSIQPEARFKEKLRFNWNTPIFASPTRKGTIYIGAQFLFRSRDRGDSWDRISPDLTTNDPEKQRQEESGGVTVDNSVAEMHTTIYSISESPLDANVLWVGTDDGNVQISRDAGKSWTNVVANVPGLPPASWVSWVEASRHAAGTAYATFDRHTFGDMTPWVYKTTNFGKSWTRIAGPDHGVRGYAHVVKEDSVKSSLLFLGTELGLWISVDGGATWAPFKGGDFPAVAVRDMVVQARDNDLVVATHGRGIWILDDLTTLRGLSNDVLAKTVTFLPGRQQQQRLRANGGWVDGDQSYSGENPPGGAMITFYQRSRHLYGPIKLEVLDAAGKVVDTISPPKRRGVNQVTWSMHLPAPRVPRAAQLAGGSQQGPRVLPGTYTLRLTKGREQIETKLKVDLDRRAPYTVADRKAQLDATLRAAALFEDMSGLVARIDAARDGARAALAKVGKDPLGDKLTALVEHLDAVKKEIVATKEGGAITGEERIREHLDHLYGTLNGWEGRPGKYQVERIDTLRRELDEVKRNFEAMATQELAPLGDELKKHNLPPIPTTARLEDNEGDDTGVASAAALRCVASRGATCDEPVTAHERD